MVWTRNSSSARKTMSIYQVKSGKLENSKKWTLGAPGPPGLDRGWPHNPPLGPMGPHGSFMVAPLFNDEAAKSRYGAQWAPHGSPKSRARAWPPPRDPSPGYPPPPPTASRAFPQCCAVAGLLTRRGADFIKLIFGLIFGGQNFPCGGAGGARIEK